jgi:hypothetical protein
VATEAAPWDAALENPPVPPALDCSRRSVSPWGGVLARAFSLPPSGAFADLLQTIDAWEGQANR